MKTILPITIPTIPPAAILSNVDASSLAVALPVVSSEDDGVVLKEIKKKLLLV